MRLLIFLTFLLFCFPFLSLFGEESGHAPKKHLFQFVRNDGQWHSNAAFKAELPGGRVYLEKDRFTYVLHDEEDMARMHRENHEGRPYSASKPIASHAYAMKFIEAKASKLSGQNAYPHYHNYFIGSDPSDWASKVPVFKAVDYRELYEGIQLKVYSQNGRLKYDYHLEAGANADRIRFEYKGTDKVQIRSGDLEVRTSVGKMVEKAPKAYQVIEGEKVPVKCAYKEFEEGIFGFTFPEGYDRSYELIIDPTVVAATYSGSTSSNYGHTATYDQDNNPFSAGASFSGGGYPTTSGAFQLNPSGSREICLTKFNPDGSAQIWATYVGGSSSDFPHSMMVDSSQNLYILGSSGSSDYPVTGGAYQSSNGGGTDIIVTGLSSNGASLVGSTYLGGSSTDGQNTPLADNYGDEYKGEIFVGNNDKVFIASMSSSTNFPTTSGVIQTSHNGSQDGVLCKLNGDLSSLLWSTYIGTSGDDAAYNIEKDPSTGEVFACGTAGGSGLPTTAGVLNPNFIGGSADGFILRMNNSATSLIASTYIGSSSRDQGYFLERDKSGEVYILGQSENASMSSSAGAYQGPTGGASKISFIRRYAADLSSNNLTSVFNSFAPTAFLVDQCEKIYAAGHGAVSTLSPSEYDTTSNAYDGDGAGFYLMVLESDATGLNYGTFFGNDGAHVDGGTSRFDPRGLVYETACTSSGSPTVPWAWSDDSNMSGWDHYLFKLDPETSGIFADASFTKNVIACNGPPVTVNFQSNNSDTIDFYWDFGDGTTDSVADPSHTYTDTGDFTVTYVAIDSTTCNISDTMTTDISIELPDSFSVDLNVPSYDNCRDSNTLTVNPTASGTNVDSIVWTMGDSTQYINDTNVTHTYDSMGTYILTVKAWSPCDSTVTATDTIHYSDEELGVTPDPSPDTVLCGTDQTVQFNNGAPDSINHHWDFGDGDTSNLSDPSHTFNDSGTFQVTYIGWDSSFCNVADTTTLQVPVHEAPEVSAEWQHPTIPPCSDSARFSANYTGTGADSLVWEFGNGDTVIGDSSVERFYSKQGSYTIEMRIYEQTCDISDSTSTSFSLAQRIEKGEILAPNVFTPNGDGDNDSFHIRYKEDAGDDVLSDLGTYKLQIYNRWGKLLYTSGDKLSSWKWDGTIDGRDAREGTYYYIVKFKGTCEEGKIKKITGHMSLLRSGASAKD